MTEGPDHPQDPPKGVQLRHDLKNHLTALLSGCDLIERCIARDDQEGLRRYLDMKRLKEPRESTMEGAAA